MLKTNYVLIHYIEHNGKIIPKLGSNGTYYFELKTVKGCLNRIKKYGFGVNNKDVVLSHIYKYYDYDAYYVNNIEKLKKLAIIEL
jgi:hypothetical protein